VRGGAPDRARRAGHRRLIGATAVPRSSSCGRVRRWAAPAPDVTRIRGRGGSPVKLLVTGGAGYIGSVCAAHLVEAGHEVTVLDDLSTGHEDAVPDGARFVQADLGDAADELLAEGFDGVLHFAARSLVGESVA